MMTNPNIHHAVHHSIHVLAVGPFGECTAQMLEQLLPGVVVTRPDAANTSLPAMWPVARINVLTSWRPVARLERMFDTLSHYWKTPFVSATLEAPNLRVGPVVVPGLGGCHACYDKRVLQHSLRPDAHLASRNFYNDHPDEGPQGYLYPFVEMAAVRVAQIIQQLGEAPETVAGKVWQLNTITRQVAYSEMIGLHGCSQCGLKRSEATRSVETLRSELSYLLPNQSTASIR